jgi:hypothetical protein
VEPLNVPAMAICNNIQRVCKINVACINGFNIRKNLLNVFRNSQPGTYKAGLLALFKENLILSYFRMVNYKKEFHT